MIPDPEIDEAVARIRDDPELVARYDVTGDGELDEREWELVRRMVALELKTSRERRTEWTLDAEPQVLQERFEVVGLLGRGGQAYTHLARDLDEDGQHVVIKELNVRVAEDWKSIELFEREAQVLERLTHPSIPRYVDAFHLDHEGDIRFMLVQQFVDGIDLGQFVVDGGRWDEETAARRLIEVCDILDYLHNKSPAVIHRDIKPSNLIVGRDDVLYLVDFGAVQTVVPTTVGGSTIIGTSGYVPMEQYMGRAVPSSDIYALGATAVHLLSGEHPADLPFEHGKLRFRGKVNVGGSLRRVLGKMVEPTIERRFSTAAELRDALVEIAPGPEEPTPRELAPVPEEPPAPEPPPKDERPLPKKESKPANDPKPRKRSVTKPKKRLPAKTVPEEPRYYVVQIEENGDFLLSSGLNVTEIVGAVGFAFTIVGIVLIPSEVAALPLFIAFLLFWSAVTEIRPRIRIKNRTCYVSGEGLWKFALEDVADILVTKNFVAIDHRSGERARLEFRGTLTNGEVLWVEQKLRRALQLPGRSARRPLLDEEE